MQGHLQTFLAVARNENPGGNGLPSFVEREFARYLECGILEHGFVRVHCDEWGPDRLVAFSCRGRESCPSCNTRRTHDTTAHSVRGVGRVVSVRALGESTPNETRSFLSDRRASNAKVLASCIRAHWAVENSLHWTLDTAFREDECRVRVDHAAANLAGIRRVALSLLKQERSVKVGIQTKRMRAAWQPDYLLKVLGVAA